MHFFKLKFLCCKIYYHASEIISPCLIALPLKRSFFFRTYEITPSIIIPMTSIAEATMIPACFILLECLFFLISSENEK